MDDSASRAAPNDDVEGRVNDKIVSSALYGTRVRLRFVLGAVELTTAQSVQLQVGQVLRLPVDVPPAVELRVDDVGVARGELISVDGRRGVRVLSVSQPSS